MRRPVQTQCIVDMAGFTRSVRCEHHATLRRVYQALAAFTYGSLALSHGILVSLAADVHAGPRASRGVPVDGRALVVRQDKMPSHIVRDIVQLHCELRDDAEDGARPADGGQQISIMCCIRCYLQAASSNWLSAY